MASALSDLKLTSYLDSLDIKVPDLNFGDYSTNAALILAKKLKENPKEAANKIIEKIQENAVAKDLVTMQEAGGFINFTLTPQFLLNNLNRILDQGDLYGCSVNGGGKTVIIEYFQNNVAKPPHVGHLRSAVIGDCLLRVFRSQGFKAVSDTHIGDWGTQFGILLFAYKEFIKAGGEKKLIEADPIDELNKLYVGMSAKIEADPALRDLGKEEFAKLEQGNTENRELWQWFVRVSLEDFENYRKILEVLPFDHNLGESFYEDKMPPILAELKQKGLLVESQGAQVVNLEPQKMGFAVLVKSDGATTYLTRDVATIKYRIEDMKLEKMLYVVDNRQAHHFNQVFEISKQANYLPDPKAVEHVDFGFMSLPEGAISTRKGTTISLRNLIDEARLRALQIIEEKNPALENKKSVSEQVALAAIKYFDLSHNRKTEIVFTWDKALSFEGNTGPYLQYTHARIHGILRKSQTNADSTQTHADTEIPRQSGFSSASVGDRELTVLRKLIQYPEIVAQVAKDYLPNNLCNYLFELSQTFNSFYQEVPVSQEQNLMIRDFRLKLITATAQVIRNGLYLLGIEAPEEM